jgi:O-antigen ligase
MSPFLPAAGFPRSHPSVLAGLALVLGSAVVGLALAVLGDATSPLLVVLVPVLVAGLVWALDRPLLAVALVPASLPVGFLVLPVGELEAVQAAMAAAIAVVAAHRLTTGRLLLPTPVGTGWLFGLLALTAVAVVTAADRRIALFQFLTLTLAALLVLAVVGACPRLLDVRRLTGLVLAAGTGVCATALPQAGGISGSTGGVVVDGATGIFTEHNQFGGFAAAVVVLAVGFLGAARTRWGRLGAGLALVVSLVAVALALSRGAYLGVLAGGLVLLVAVPRMRRIALLLTAPAAVVLALTVALAPQTGPLSVVLDRFSSFADPAANPQDDRPAIWAEALRQVVENPWTGSGPANMPVVAGQVTSQVSVFAPTQAHNVPLTVAAEVGLPAAAVLVVLTVLWSRLFFRRMRQLGNDRDRALLAALTGAAATFVAHGAVDAILRSSVVLALLVLCVGLALAVASAEDGYPRRGDVEVEPRRPQRPEPMILTSGPARSGERPPSSGPDGDGERRWA